MFSRYVVRTECFEDNYQDEICSLQSLETSRRNGIGKVSKLVEPNKKFL